MDNSIPTKKESTLNDAIDANVTHFRVISTDKSEKIPKQSVSLQGTQVKVSTSGLDATNAQDAVTELKALNDTKADNSTYSALDAAKADHGYGEEGETVKTLKEVEELKVDKDSIVQTTGMSDTTVMGQKTVTEELGTKANHGYPIRVLKHSKKLKGHLL